MDYASLQIPMRVWQMAGLWSGSVRQATRELLHKMKKVKYPLCLGGPNQVNETLNHILLHCEYYKKVQEEYLPKFLQQNCQLGEILSNETLIVQTILDLLSYNLSGNEREGWASPKAVYWISRQFCYSLHKMLDNLYKEADSTC